MTSFLSNLPNGRKVFTDQNGAPLAGGFVYYYTVGTTTLVTTYKTYDGATLNSNPVVLDAAGSCTVFAAGQLREYVTDSLGNVISDGVVSANPVSTAMLPVVQATTLSSAMTALGISTAVQPALSQASAQAALTALGASGGSLGGTVAIANLQSPAIAMNPAAQTLAVNPTANATTTQSSFNVQATTTSGNANRREFLANLGLTSNQGNGGTAGNDKVALYVGTDAQSGTSDVWCINPCLTMEASSGSYNAQTVEIDLNNLCAHRGDAGLSTGLAAPIAVNLSVTTGPQSTYRTTAGISIVSNQLSGGSTGTMNRGIVLSGSYNQAAIQDVSFNTPIGLQLTGNYSIAGVDTSVSSGNVGLYMRNTQSLSWKNGAGTSAVSDTVDALNYRLIGSGATGVKVLNDLLPYSTTINSGSASLPWQTLYTATGTVATSDPSKKADIQPLQDARALVKAIQPISFKWKDPEQHQDRNFGFNAAEVKQAFADAGHTDFAGHTTCPETGVQGLRHDQLLGTLWQAVKDTLGVVDALRQEIIDLKAGRA